MTTVYLAVCEFGHEGDEALGVYDSVAQAKAMLDELHPHEHVGVEAYTLNLRGAVAGWYRYPSGRWRDADDKWLAGRQRDA